jgi:hypothetical protein
MKCDMWYVVCDMCLTLGRLTSMMDLKTSTSSGRWPSDRFKLPAALSTAITARMP